MVAKTPFGERKIVTVAGGTFKGTRLHGTILNGGAGWALTRNDGWLQLDVRLTLETDDGARIFMPYRDIRHGQEAILARLSNCTVLLIMAYSQHLRTFREIGHGKWIGNAI